MTEKKLADDHLSVGSQGFDDETLEIKLLGITDLVDDIRAPLNDNELVSAAVKLMLLLADFIFELMTVGQAREVDVKKAERN
ncbi:MAG: hypothetical protein HON90_02115 [Halobacteriovoraceae bacterium]|nr:hypothetical protein [Halobacteriovoraceae bacterium]